ncbi:PAS domain-containing protein [Aliarcobacter butzleri]|uniref:Chemotaxis protein n=1 Tax=Aliarcobacter butzleri L352 TaxID=1447260 RepID=A0A837JBE0_9BACT|nr:PAS domain-containing protein [Aliarcobacter butzleri]KLE03913.1 chemotaxis protein [Aliarcobacter butzleri L352]
MNNEIILTKDIMIVSETDEKGNILYANADFCKIAGFSREELIGKPHNLVRHFDMPKDAFGDLWKTINNGNVWKGIVKNKTKQGEFYWVNATVYPSKTVDGRKRYISVRVKPTQEEIDIATKLYLNMK